MAVCVKEASVVSENDVYSLVIGENVTVTVKVKKVDPVEDVKNRDGKVLKKQDVVVGGADGCTKVVSWEDDIGKMEKCYVQADSSGGEELHQCELFKFCRWGRSVRSLV